MDVRFVCLCGKEIFHESKHEDIPHFEAGFARQEHFIARHNAKDALPIFGQAFFTANPSVLSHVQCPLKVGLRFSKNAETPSSKSQVREAAA